jgi:hypothetical protein
MLALILSGAVALASLIFFFSAFFAPKLHRKDDFLWSGFGFFYGLVLWNCAQRLTGAVLLGQLVAVILILAFAWQTLRLRAAIAKNAVAEVPSFSLLDWLGGGLKRKPKAPVVVPGKVQEKVTEEKISKVEDQEKSEPPVDKVHQTKVVAEEVAEILVETAEEVVEELNTAAETITETVLETAEELVEPTPSLAQDEPQAEEKQAKTVEVTPKKPKSKLFQRLFGGKPKPSPVVAPVVNLPVPDPETTDDEDWGEDLELSISENQENQEAQIAPASEVIEEVGEEIAQVIEEIVAKVEEAEKDEEGQEMVIEEITVSVEAVVTPITEELTTPSQEEPVAELVELTEESAALEITENKVPEAYAAYVEPEDPAEAIADELDSNNNDQDNAPQP